MTTAPPGGVPAIQSGASSQLATDPDIRKDGGSHRSVQDVAQTAKDQAGNLKDHATKIVEDAKQQASEAVESVKDKARGMADVQKSAGADQIDGVARAVHSAADGLKEQMPGAAEYVHEAAAGIERFSSTLRTRSVDEIVSNLTSFARTQPTAFFGATVLAGFALSRFLKSSAERTASEHMHAGGGASAHPYRQPSPHGGPSPAMGDTAPSGNADNRSNQYGRL